MSQFGQLSKSKSIFMFTSLPAIDHIFIAECSHSAASVRDVFFSLLIYVICEACEHNKVHES